MPTDLDPQNDELLAAVPLIAALPADVAELVTSAFTIRDHPFGETVFAAGDEADGYHVVLDGVARVLVVGDDGSEVSLNLLERGDAFGEAALLDGTPRTATVRASSPLRLARLDRGLFTALLDRYPDVRNHFGRVAETRQIRDFVRLHSGFSALSPAATQRLIDGLIEERVAADETVCRAGDPADSLYLIKDGRLTVFAERDGTQIGRLRTLHSGEFFGEAGLLGGGTRTATVVAEGPATLLRLDGELFRSLLQDEPEFATRIRERMGLYAARDAAVRAGRDVEAPPEGVWDPSDPGLAVTEHGAEELLETDPYEIPKRFPTVRQIDQMDCGAACIAMLCRGFGHDVSMTTIRYAVGTGTSGTTLRGIVLGGGEIGLEMRALKSSVDRIGQLPLPAVIHWEGNHWVVLYRVAEEHIWIADPARGRRRVAMADVAEAWSGFAATSTPTERLAAAPRGGLDLSWMWTYVRPHSRKLALAFVLALLIAGLEMLMPVVTQIVVDRVIGHHDRHVLTVVMLAMVGVLLLSVGLTIVQRRMLARVASVLDADTLDFISMRMLALPMRYFDARRTGDIERRLSGMQQVRSLIVGSGVAGATAATQLIVAVTLMFIYSWILGVVYLSCAPLYGLLLRYSQQRMRPIFDSVEAGHGKYQSRQIDALRGISTVKAMGVESGLRLRMRLEFAELREKLFRADLVGMVYEGLVSTVTFAVYGLFLFVAAELALSGELSIGQFVSFNALVLLANTPLMTLLGLWDRLQMVTVLMGRVQDVIDTEPEQPAGAGEYESASHVQGHIRLRGVSFAPPSSADKPILRDITLDVSPGSTIALVGRSGSGKSTLARCISGLVMPTAGEIEYDGTEIRRLRFTELRRKIGFVLQDAYLFDDTIAANIAFGELEPDPARIVRAAEIAYAADFINQLPLGYETRIGDSGLKLSGGQAQRIAIARALYHEPPILIFDEATSALDSEAERSVKENLDRVLEGRTAFVIAHRLSTIRDADLICVMEAGRIVERGRHEELLRRGGLYAYLVAQQIEG